MSRHGIRLQSEQRLMPKLSAAVTMYFIAWIGQIVITLALHLLVHSWPGINTGVMNAVSSILFEGGCLLLPTALYCGRKPGLHRGVRLNDSRAIYYILAAMVAVAAVMAAYGLGTLWIRLLAVLGAKVTQTSTGVSGTSLLVATKALLPALCEELLFHGFILSAVEPYGQRRALYISTIAFAALHGSLVGLPVHLIISFTLGLITIYSDSIYPAILGHFLFNSFSICLSILESGIGLSDNVISLVFLTVLSGFVTTGFVLMMKRLSRRRITADRDEGNALPLTPSDVIVLAACIVTAAAAYLVDTLSLWEVF